MNGCPTPLQTRGWRVRRARKMTRLGLFSSILSISSIFSFRSTFCEKNNHSKQLFFSMRVFAECCVRLTLPEGRSNTQTPPKKETKIIYELSAVCCLPFICNVANSKSMNAIYTCIADDVMKKISNNILFLIS